MIKTVLIADDSKFMRLWLRDMIGNNSRYKVVTEAKDGIEALDRCKEFLPDIVLLDITMPKINGIEVLKRIHEFNPDINVIMCSALGQKTLMLEALQNGAKDFIVKPYFGDLVSTLKNLDS